MATESTTGLYLWIIYSEESKKQLAQWIKQSKIPNAEKEASLHTTVVSSKDPIDFPENHTLDIEVDLSLSSFECWKTAQGNCLVLKIFSPYMHFRFQESIRAGATYAFDEYHPHITLSHDIGDWDWTKLKRPEFVMQVVGECAEPLDTEMMQ